MNKSEKQRLLRLRTELRSMCRAYNDLFDAKDDIDAHLAWANFARSCRTAYGLILGTGKHCQTKKAEAWRFENKTARDELFQFLISSRNHIDHPEDDNKDSLVSGKVFEESYLIGPAPDGGGIVSLPKNFGGTFTMVDCQIDGRDVDGFISRSNGKLTVFGNIPVALRRKGFYLAKVSKLDGTVIEVPRRRGEAFGTTAEEIATHCALVIRDGAENLLSTHDRLQIGEDWKTFTTRLDEQPIKAG